MRSKAVLTLSVAVGSSGLGYFLGKNESGSNRNIFEDLNVFLKTSRSSAGAGRPFLFSSAYAKSKSNISVPSRLEDTRLVSNHEAKLVPSLLSRHNPNSNTEALNKFNSGDEIVKYGFPSNEYLLAYEEFILSYDKRNKIANWVLEHLTPENLEPSDAKRSNMKYTEDTSVDCFFRSTLDDYSKSGYDNCHLAAVANHKHNENAMSETFLLSNIAPQVGKGFDQHAWNDLENYTRTVVQRNKNVYVCTGPLFIPRTETEGCVEKLYVKYEVIGANHVAVPTHFFKVLLIENHRGEFELESFILANEKHKSEPGRKQYAVDIDTIERASGLRLFSNIPRNKLTNVNNKYTGRKKSSFIKRKT